MKKRQISLKNKVALVTGAAHGIGRVIAEALASSGASVVVADIQESLGRLVVKDICAAGGSAIFIRTDLRKEKDIKNLISKAVKKYRRLDIIINNARPRLKLMPFDESFKEWDLAMGVLLKAPALLIKYALPHLIKTKKASIVNIASTNAFFISHQPATYHIAKAALVQLTRYIAFGFGKDGIRANVVCPGLVDLTDIKTPLTSNAVNNNIVKLIVPLNRAATPLEIANVVVALCTDSSSYITGQVINVDGGLTLGDQFHIARNAYTKGQSYSG